MDRERCTGARGHVGVAPAPLPAESIHMWEMPSGLPVDPIRDLKGGAIAQLTEPVLIDETRTIDETRHDEVGCNRRHLAGGSPPSPQTVSASSLGVAKEDAVDVGTV